MAPNGFFWRPEFVDNTLAACNPAKTNCNKILCELTFITSLHIEECALIVRDRGPGIKDMQKALAALYTEEDRTIRDEWAACRYYVTFEKNEWNMGMKAAAFFFSNSAVVRTRAKDSEQVVEALLDRERLEKQERDRQILTAPTRQHAPGSLQQSFIDSRLHDHPTLRQHLLEEKSGWVGTCIILQKIKPELAMAFTKEGVETIYRTLKAVYHPYIFGLDKTLCERKEST